MRQEVITGNLLKIKLLAFCLGLSTACAPPGTAPLTPPRVLEDTGAPLFFREDWQQIPASTPITQEHVANLELVLHTYGTARDRIRKSHHENIPNDPFYVWSGQADGSWGVTLSRRGYVADFSRGGVIRWRSRQSGEHFPRLLIRLLNGEFYVSDQTDENLDAWHIFEFILPEVTWSRLDPEHWVPLPEAPAPDLRQVAEVGFTDLEPGRGTPGSTRIDWIEVYGWPLPRP